MDLSFDPQKSLFSLAIVKLIIKLSFGSSCLISIIISLHAHDVPWDLSGEGFSRFVELFKVPLSILAIGLTLVGLCGANHRSEQAKQQMNLTSGQNTFSNHYKHIEEFEKYLSSSHKKRAESSAEFGTSAEVEVRKNSVAPFVHIDEKKYRTLYKKIYPNSKNGELKVSEDIITDVNSFIDKIYLGFKELTICPEESRSIIRVSISEEIASFSKTLFIVDNRGRHQNLYGAKSSKNMRGDNLVDLIFTAQYFVETIDDVLKFDFDYTTQEQVTWLTEATFRWEEIRNYKMENIEIPKIDKLFKSLPPSQLKTAK